MEYKYNDITKLIIRAALNVLAIPGNDFQEAIYQKALAVEFRLMGIDFMPKVINGKDTKSKFNSNI